MITGRSASSVARIKSPKYRQFRGNFKKQHASIISKHDIERLNIERNSSLILKDEIKTADIAGTNDSRIVGNKANRTACVLFHTPKAGFTYAVAEEKTCL